MSKNITPRAKNQTVAPITSARPPKSFPKMPTVSPMRPAVSPTRPTVSPVCPKRLSSAGEGGSKYNRISPQAENDVLGDFFPPFRLIYIYQYLKAHNPPPRTAISPVEIQVGPTPVRVASKRTPIYRQGTQSHHKTQTSRKRFNESESAPKTVPALSSGIDSVRLYPRRACALARDAVWSPL